jgi:hypothetical protein
MSQQFINIGATPNDGLGDPIRTAFQKTNNNFSQLFPIANVVAITGNGISVTGNVSGNYFIGNGAFLTGISSTYGNANVANYLPTFSGNLTSLNTITATGNVTASNFIGNLSDGTSKISIASSGNVSVGVGPFGTTVLNINTSTGISVLGNVVASQAVSAVGNISGNNITANNLLTFANLAVSGGTPLVATDTTIAFKIPVVINGTTYYISLTAAQ